MSSPFRALLFAAVAFTFGLLTGSLNDAGSLIITGIILLLFTLNVLLFRKQKQLFQIIALLVLWFLIGWSRNSLNRNICPPEGRCWIDGKVTLPVESEGKEARVRITNIKWRKASTYGKLPGKAILTTPKSKHLQAGDRIRFLGFVDSHTGARNPGDFNPRAYWGIRGINYNIRSPVHLEKLPKRRFSSTPLLLIDSLRKKSSAILRQHVSPQNVPVAMALFVGDRTGWDQGLREKFAQSGIMHLFAISGFHVGIFAITLLWTLPLLRISSKMICTITILLLWLYVAFTGANPPVVRAVVMISIALLGRIAGRRYRSGYTLALSYLVLLMWRPQGLFDAGFQLSFAGTAAVIFSTAFITPRHAWYTRISSPGIVRSSLKYIIVFRDALAASIAAFIFTSPFMILHFGYLPWFGPLVVLPATILVWFTMISGWLTLLLSFLPFIPDVFGAALNGLIQLLVHLTRISTDNFPAAGSVPANVIFSAIAIMFLFIVFSPRIRMAPTSYLSLGAISIGTIIVWTLLWLPEQNVKIAVLDVDQGDGILIRRGNRAVIIDGGKSSNHALEKQVRLSGIRNIDLLVLTHGDADHTGAVRSLVGKIPINAALVGPGTWRDKEGNKTIKALIENGVSVYTGYKNTKIELGQLGRIEVLNPPVSIDQEMTSDNDLSLVLLWENNGNSALFPGDISYKAEIKISIEGNLKPVDLLLAAHHGSRFSTSQQWLEKLNPRFIAISCGRNNPYGHPAPGVLTRCKTIETKISRTDEEGALIYALKPGGLEKVDWNKWW
ncbi:MAG: DNA internalization-related competence protein ComEC/Rec2 [Candidatus Electryonea clarkiae]|nr:DNA internalization-related competence protein ComEC/Rec2 [Candidatus Electryonea clarkiae]MDP8289256.1 DNA internalization-related competence protein ComEC/Rec2 [Candidatus Electryonea clarkiae]